MSTPPAPLQRRTGPVVIGYDGTPISQRALAEAAAVLAPRDALVVVVWEAGRAFEAAEWEALNLGTPVPTLDFRSALEMDRAALAAAERTAQQGAGLARSLGWEAESLVVADDVSIADTLLRVVEEKDAAAVVVGAHGHGRFGEVLLGSTSRHVIRHAPCPVFVVREQEERKRR